MGIQHRSVDWADYFREDETAYVLSVSKKPQKQSGLGVCITIPYPQKWQRKDIPGMMVTGRNLDEYPPILTEMVKQEKLTIFSVGGGLDEFTVRAAEQSDVTLIDPLDVSVTLGLFEEALRKQHNHRIREQLKVLRKRNVRLLTDPNIHRLQCTFGDAMRRQLVVPGTADVVVDIGGACHYVGSEKEEGQELLEREVLRIRRSVKKQQASLLKPDGLHVCIYGNRLARLRSQR